VLPALCFHAWYIHLSLLSNLPILAANDTEEEGVISSVLDSLDEVICRPASKTSIQQSQRSPAGRSSCTKASSTSYNDDGSEEEIYDVMAKFETINFDIFLSHAWSADAHQRPNHERVMKLAEALKKRGAAVWIDSEQLTGTGDFESHMLM
jgi:hypothetical protein